MALRQPQRQPSRHKPESPQSKNHQQQPDIFQEVEPVDDHINAVQRAHLTPGQLTPPQVLYLQRTIGNRAVGRLLTPSPAVRRKPHRPNGNSLTIQRFTSNVLAGHDAREASETVGQPILDQHGFPAFDQMVSTYNTWEFQTLSMACYWEAPEQLETVEEAIDRLASIIDRADAVLVSMRGDTDNAGVLADLIAKIAIVKATAAEDKQDLESGTFHPGLPSLVELEDIVDDTGDDEDLEFSDVGTGRRDSVPDIVPPVVPTITEDTTTTTTTPKKSFKKRHPLLVAGLKSVRNFLILPYVQSFNLGQGITAACFGDRKAAAKYLGKTALGKVWNATFGAGTVRGEDEATMFGEAEGKRSFGKWLVDLKELAKEVAAWATFIALVTGIIGIFAPPFQAVATTAGTVAAISAAVMAGLSLVNVIYDSVMLVRSDSPKQKVMLKWKLGKDIIDVLVGVGSAIIGGIGGITAFDASGARGVGEVVGGNLGAMGVGLEGDVKDELYDQESNKETTRVQPLRRSPDLTVMQRALGGSEEAEQLMSQIEKQIDEKDRTVATVKQSVAQDSSAVEKHGAEVGKAKQTFDKELGPAFGIPGKADQIEKDVESQDPDQELKQAGKNKDDSKLNEIDDKLNEAESKTGEAFDGGERPSRWSRFKGWFSRKFNFIKRRVSALIRKLKLKITAGIMKAMGMDAPIKKFSTEVDGIVAEQKGLEQANREGGEQADEAGQKVADIKQQLAAFKQEIGD